MNRREREDRNEAIRERLGLGRTCTEIARELGLSLRVVSGVALRAGHRSRPGPPCRYDWEAIRRYNEAGHTKRECRERFGFSSGAWDQAVIRGAIVPRSRPDPIKHSHRTRKEVGRRLAGGRTQAEIARDLRISKGTVAYHVRALGIPPDRRFGRRYDWLAIQSAYDSGMVAAECRREFGCSKASWHQAVKRGELVVRPRKVPLATLLSVGRRRSRFHLKARLIDEGLKNARCERCRLSEWRGQPLSLELHHVNGDPHDNRLESLQILCPNCHSQTENFGSRNARRDTAA
jgi:DNA-binding CsgD family transcriptional regulator